MAQVWHASSAAEQAHPDWEPILEATMAPFARDLGTVLSVLEARPQARPSRRWRRHPERLKRVIERALPGDGELFSGLELLLAIKIEMLQTHHLIFLQDLVL